VSAERQTPSKIEAYLGIDIGSVSTNLVVTDAAQHVKELDPRRLVQFRLPKATRWALVALAGWVGAVAGTYPFDRETLPWLRPREWLR
jgi:hypothetical protein